MHRYRGEFEHGLPHGVCEFWPEHATKGRRGAFSIDDFGNLVREARRDISMQTRAVEAAIRNAERAEHRAIQCAEFDQTRQETTGGQGTTAGTSALPPREPKEVLSYRQALAAPGCELKLALVDSLAVLLHDGADGSAINAARDRVLYAVGKAHGRSKALLQKHEEAGGTPYTATEHVPQAELNVAYKANLIQQTLFMHEQLSMQAFLSNVAKMQRQSISVSKDDAQISRLLAASKSRVIAPAGALSTGRRNGADQVEAVRQAAEDREARMTPAERMQALRTERAGLVRTRNRIEQQLVELDQKLEELSSEDVNVAAGRTGGKRASVTEVGTPCAGARLLKRRASSGPVSYSEL